jgi:hypothetical protein
VREIGTLCFGDFSVELTMGFPTEMYGVFHKIKNKNWNSDEEKHMLSAFFSLSVYDYSAGGFGLTARRIAAKFLNTERCQCAF